MQMKHTIFAVISPNRERVADWDTRDQAEADATRRGEGFEVRLLDRRLPKLTAMEATCPLCDGTGNENLGDGVTCQCPECKGYGVALVPQPPKPVPAGIECFLVGATEAERTRALEIYER